MAKIVLGIGSSHGPSIQTPPEGWPMLGEGDPRDPRMDYEALLKAAPPELADELTPEKHSARHAAAHAAIGTLKDKITDARPDVLVVISNPHRIHADDNQVVFGVIRSEEIPAAKRSDAPFNPDDRFRDPAGRPKPEIVQRRGNPSLANHLVRELVTRGFDVACRDGVREGEAIDDAYTYVYDWLLADGTEPDMVPLMLSRYMPYQPTPARCYAFGTALREVIESWDADLRVGLVASGGLSHQIIDEELDRRVIAALASTDEAELTSLSREQLNRAPGTPEILNWVTVAAAMAPVGMTLVDYVTAYRSPAGTGHGLTFGVWD
jgi:hypothetical protein